MSNALLLDFGASRVKSAILDDNYTIKDCNSYNPVKPCNLIDKKFEISLDKITIQFKEIAYTYYKKHKFDKILISSQMHGFIILNQNNEPLSDYISWMDERCLNSVNNISSLDILKNKLENNFLSKTGMNIRPCYPVFKLYDILKTNVLNEKNIKIISLPEWICACDEKSLNTVHETMIAGSGFYNIHDKKIDLDIIDLFKEFRTEILFNSVTLKIDIGGYINIENTDIPVYNGVGDCQCAIYGAGNSNDTISLNLGTGSQIAMIDLNNCECEKRPFFDNKILSVITHIPSGRALNTYINFLQEINPDIDYWAILSKITLNEVKKSDLEFDLGVFSSAWNFKNNKGINGINEFNFTLKNYLSSLLKSYLQQYETGISNLCYNKKIRNKIILSGGIADKLPVIKEYFEDKGYITKNNYTGIDETFLGLMKLYKNEGKWLK